MDKIFMNLNHFFVQLSIQIQNLNIHRLYHSFKKKKYLLYSKSCFKCKYQIRVEIRSNGGPTISTPK